MLRPIIRLDEEVLKLAIQSTYDKFIPEFVNHLYYTIDKYPDDLYINVKFKYYNGNGIGTHGFNIKMSVYTELFRIKNIDILCE